LGWGGARVWAPSGTQQQARLRPQHAGARGARHLIDGHAMCRSYTRAHTRTRGSVPERSMPLVFAVSLDGCGAAAGCPAGVWRAFAASGIGMAALDAVECVRALTAPSDRPVGSRHGCLGSGVLLSR